MPILDVDDDLDDDDVDEDSPPDEDLAALEELRRPPAMRRAAHNPAHRQTPTKPTQGVGMPSPWEGKPRDGFTSTMRGRVDKGEMNTAAGRTVMNNRNVGK